jgi:acetyl-CoA synthetase
VRDLTHADLLRDVPLCANALKGLGIGKGDVVGIYLPMIPEVVVAMLACARIGALHNVVFGGFSAGSVSERLEFSEAKALITVDGPRRKGKTAPVKSELDAHLGSLEHLERRNPGRRGPRVPGRADGVRTPAVHPLLVRLHGQAEGHPPHHRRLHDRCRVDVPAGVRHQARV